MGTVTSMRGVQPCGPVEIVWIVCERCGALCPRIERSQKLRMLQAVCCGPSEFRGLSARGFPGDALESEFVSQMEES